LGGTTYTCRTQRQSDNNNELEYYSDEILNSESDFTVFPNPISIGEIKFNKRVSQFTLFNSSGQVALIGNDSKGFNIDNLNKGIYLLKVDNIVRKIIIE